MVESREKEQRGRRVSTFMFLFTTTVSVPLTSHNAEYESGQNLLSASPVLRNNEIGLFATLLRPQQR